MFLQGYLTAIENIFMGFVDFVFFMNLWILYFLWFWLILYFLWGLNYKNYTLVYASDFFKKCGFK